MTLQERIHAAWAFDASRFIPFLAGGFTIGQVRRDFLHYLGAYRDVLVIADGSVALRDDLDGREARTQAMAHVAASLAARGLLSTWRNETFEIRALGSEAVLFVLERAAVRFFGLTARAVHVNGLVKCCRENWMWIARRSPDKAIDPDMFDNLVGGGVASGLSLEQTLVKEAWEEAGIDCALARRACAAGTLRVCREVPDGLHAEVIHAYDLFVADDFLPLNQDGEVVEFRRLGFEEVARELESDARYTIDAGLVAVDCLRRHLPDFAARLSSRD